MSGVPPVLVQNVDAATFQNYTVTLGLYQSRQFNIKKFNVVKSTIQIPNGTGFNATLYIEETFDNGLTWIPLAQVVAPDDANPYTIYAACTGGFARVVINSLNFSFLANLITSVTTDSSIPSAIPLAVNATMIALNGATPTNLQCTSGGALEVSGTFTPPPAVVSYLFSQSGPGVATVYPGHITSVSIESQMSYPLYFVLFDNYGTPTSWNDPSAISMIKCPAYTPNNPIPIITFDQPGYQVANFLQIVSFDQYLNYVGSFTQTVAINITGY